MALELSQIILNQIHAYGEASYPEEGAGFLLGHVYPLSPDFGRGDGGEGFDRRLVTAILGLENAREDAARHNRYLLTPQDYLRGEQEAARLGLDVLGVFHSHPDHPNRPSEFDRDWAMPWFSYLITSVQSGRSTSSRSWRLAEDRSQFYEERIEIRELRIEGREP
jgi:proteasome lid subunit RPN8/RPN11